VKILLLSAYAAQSHVHWQQTLQSMFPHWEWTVLDLPPRHFSWRVRGNALYWSLIERDTLEQAYDLLIATSMVDLATLRGLVPALTRLRTVVYFHENQFEYPQHNQQHSLLDAQVASIYTALSADALLFNSRYNLDSFMAGCAALLGKLPDRVPPGVVSILQAKATVLPVPIDIEKYSMAVARWPGVRGRSGGGPLRLLWVGQFEHDKGGEGLLSILRILEGKGLDFELAVTGQQFRRSPEVFREIESAFTHRIVQFGYVEPAADYRALLRAAEIVLSTALHEFQGLAVMEAVAAGCLPVVPDRLGYREIYPSHSRYATHTDDPEREAESAPCRRQDKQIPP
jgi:glycosyltransferase involved in cell wall biosynthesis